MKEYFLGFSMEQWVVITFCVGFDESKGVDGAIESVLRFKGSYKEEPDTGKGVAYLIDGEYKTPERTRAFWELRRFAHIRQMVDRCPEL
jgi:hypothetical protein